MSTRANVLIKDDNSKLWFYRHSDGYPDGALPTLKKFMEWVKEGKIRNNPSQSAGWLIMIGAEEYNYIMKYDFKNPKNTKETKKPTITEPIENEWKVGAYEPTNGRHGDIEYLYVLDLNKMTIDVYDTPLKEIDKLINTIEFKKETKCHN